MHFSAGCIEFAQGALDIAFDLHGEGLVRGGKVLGARDYSLPGNLEDAAGVSLAALAC